MRFLLDIWDRIRQFDPRKLSPAQIVVGIAAVLVLIWGIGTILSFVMSTLNFIMPFAAAVIALYVGYNWLQSRAESLPDAAKKSDKEKRVEEAVSNVEAFKRGENPNEKPETQNKLEDIALDVPEEFVQEQDDEKLVIKQVINPETGFKEPDIARLIEHEEAKLKEAENVNDAVKAQIEARRKRLQNKDGGGS